MHIIYYEHLYEFKWNEGIPPNANHITPRPNVLGSWPKLAQSKHGQSMAKAAMANIRMNSMYPHIGLLLSHQ